jgi:hypothetical protein
MKDTSAKFLHPVADDSLDYRPQTLPDTWFRLPKGNYTNQPRCWINFFLTKGPAKVPLRLYATGF